MSTTIKKVSSLDEIKQIVDFESTLNEEFGPFPYKIDFVEGGFREGKMTLCFMNTNMKKARERLMLGKAQRLVLDLPEIATRYEFVLTPCDNKWEQMRITGTDQGYYLVSAVDKSCYSYPFRFGERLLHTSYIIEKTHIDPYGAVALSYLLFLMGTGENEQRLLNEINKYGNKTTI
jgi:hypothetical protein